ncbi:MAG: cell division protein ZapA [Hyphomicrobiaceae bacterium]|nr:cell division protein ZapA [Hyphomicrobiaceae bacterium]
MPRRGKYWTAGDGDHAVGEVAITVNGRTYRLACQPGGEVRLRQIGDYVTAKLEGLVAQHGQIGNERLLLMAALIIADELLDEP